MMELKPCPFCGGKARLSFKDCAFYGQNVKGDKKLKYRFQVICNKCHSRGKPIVTDWLINPKPYASMWSGRFEKGRKHAYAPSEFVLEMTETLRPWAEKAIDEWNKRTTETAKHGHWEKAKYIEAPVYICSECGNREPLPRKFCPECGLMMETD